MPLALNEIRDRAGRFARAWRDDRGLEQQEAQTFWNEFLEVFGVSRRRVASFEVPVDNLFSADRTRGRIDLLWKGRLLAEHKSRGGDLDRAATQARDYFAGLRDSDLPRLTVVSDFDRIRVYDNERGARDGGAPAYDEFTLDQLPGRIGLFGALSGHETRRFGNIRPVDREAARGLRALHDALRETGYEGHPLEVLMVRLLFCLFADNAGVWEAGLFRDWLDGRTQADGSDLGGLLNVVFSVLDKAPEARTRTLDETLKALPHVNGALFKERHDAADFTGAMRGQLLDLARLDWAAISPEIFGSLFQGIRSTAERRATGEHYTSEANILKALGPLFLDGLRAEFATLRRDPRRLLEFHRRLSAIRVLDPACGCGNFLVVAYRELRLLELEVLRARYTGTAATFSGVLSQVRVEQFAGIELNEWPAQIARVAMWLTDHQMNLRVSEEFSRLELRFPLGEGARIAVGNALALDWGEAAGGLEGLSYIVGNPPFVGKHFRTEEQVAGMQAAMPGFRNVGDVDYVAAWFFRAASLIQGTTIRCALVATNSITQGEQVASLWPTLFQRFGIKIHFAHRTFHWTTAAPGAAAVHCVVIGFASFDIPGAEKILFDYDDNEVPTRLSVANISPYLTDGGDVAITKRSAPLGPVPIMRCGNKPSDGGAFILSDIEADALRREEPAATPFIKRFGGGDEFLNGGMRWCLWLIDAEPNEIAALPQVRNRVQRVREFRLQSSAAPTRKAANTPARFFFVSQPRTEYLIIPEVSSERRIYVPVGRLNSEVISSNTAYLVPDPSLYLLGVLSSIMHMAWMRQIAGRLKSDFRYSASIVYNNFPWPDPTPAQRATIEARAGAVLDARATHPASTLATLYDPVTMPADLTRAHTALDRAVDAAYGPPRGGWSREADRVAFLFARHAALAAPLAPAARPTRRRARVP